MAKNIIINAETLFDGKRKLNNVSVVIENDKIIEIGKKRQKADFTGVVTPAFIDAHSHIGMARFGEPGAEDEANDITDQFLPINDPLNSVYFDDLAFREAVDFGVLYSCIVPGSGNLLGGRAMIIKNYARHRQEALLRDYGYKMALGYNPRSTHKWKGTRPNTRMGIYGMLEKKFDSVLLKKQKTELARDKKLKELDIKVRSGEKKMNREDVEFEKKTIEKEYQLDFDCEERALLELLEGTADHLGDVHHKEIFDQLANNDIPVVYGPLGSLPYKVELKNESYKNTELLMKSKAHYGLMTDHPVIMAPALRDSLKFFLIFGMKEEEAVSLISYKNAAILGIDDILGSVEPGKLASLTVWDRNPLQMAAYPNCVMAEGKVIRKGM